MWVNVGLMWRASGLLRSILASDARCWPLALHPGFSRSILASCARFCFMPETITNGTTPGNNHAIVSMRKRHPELVDKSARLTSTLYDHLVRSKLILRKVIFYGAALQCWGMLSLPGLLVDALRQNIEDPTISNVASQISMSNGHQHWRARGMIFGNSSD